MLTGSQHFAMLRSVSQTLAGRVGYINLRPFSLAVARDAEAMGGRAAGGAAFCRVES